MSRLPVPVGSEPTPLEEIFHAIEDEIAAVDRDPAKSIDVFDGSRLHRGIGGSLYAVRAESPLQLQPETPIQLVRDGESVPGTLVAVDDFDIVIHLREDVGPVIPSGTLSTSPTFILERLRDRLQSVLLMPHLPEGGVPGATWQPEAANVDTNEPLALEAAQALAAIADPALHPNESQWRAMATAAGSDLHFVWGPPGTGKTAALAQTARMLADAGERVLVLAHANVAVDVVLTRIADAFAGTAMLAESAVLRVGDPHLESARARHEILVETAVEKQSPHVVEELRDLVDRRREVTKALRELGGKSDADPLAAELRRVRERLSTVRQEYREAASRAIQGAQVVGATLSRLALSDDVWEWRPDAILLDEASMVSFPWVLAAATRTSTRLVVYGDFRQLPPVVVAQSDVARHWLGSDVFEISGVRARIDDGIEDPRVTLLDTQYRMAPSLGSVVSDFAYGGRLRTDPTAGVAASRLSAREPFAGESVVVVDTSGLAPGCDVESKEGSFSRVNPIHLAVGLTLAGVGDDCALITPYRAQARLFDAGLPGAGNLATAATVHRYQGSERDFVVFDFVDAPPLRGASALTGAGDVDVALRLTNVALSRARGKVAVIADLSFLADRLAPESPIRRAVELCAERGTVIAGSDALFKSSVVTWTVGSVDTVLQGVLSGSQTEVMLNVPRDMSVGIDVRETLREAVRRVPSCLVAAGPGLVRSLEHLPCELRLLTRSSLVLLVDGTTAIVGGRASNVAARIEIPALVAALKSSVFGVHGHQAPRRLSATHRRELPAGSA